MSTSTYIKIGAGVLTVALLFGSGWAFRDALAERDEAELRAEQATQIAAMEADFRKKENSYAENLAAAWDENATLKSSNQSLSASVSRVRKQAAEYKRRLSESDADTVDALRAKLAACVGIVESGAGVVAECADFSRNTAIDKDTLAKIATGGGAAK